MLHTFPGGVWEHGLLQRTITWYQGIDDLDTLASGIDRDEIKDIVASFEICGGEKHSNLEIEEMAIFEALKFWRSFETDFQLVYVEFRMLNVGRYEEYNFNFHHDKTSRC